MSKKGIGKFVLGASLGAGLGLLFAPKKGEEMRKELSKKLDDLLQKAKEIDVDEVKGTIETKINEIETELKDLDKEKAKDVAKKKAKDISKKADELVAVAVEKGTPVVKKAAKEVKAETAKVLKTAVKKLEEK